MASSTWARHHIHPPQLQSKEPVTEALCRATCKCPGRQKIHTSEKWGFTKFSEDEFEDVVGPTRPIPDGCGVNPPLSWPLDKWRALHSRALALPPLYTHQ